MPAWVTCCGCRGGTDDAGRDRPRVEQAHRGSIADELIVGKVLAEADLERATAIAAQMLYIHLVSGERPDSATRRYKDGLWASQFCGLSRSEERCGLKSS